MPYQFKFEFVGYVDREFIDMEFTDNSEGHMLRNWRMTYQVNSSELYGMLQLAESEDHEFRDWRNIENDELEDMWRAIPNEIKLRYAMFRK